MNRLIYYIVTLVLTIGYSADSLAFQSEEIVSSIEEFNTAVDNAEPGSVIVMKDGKWKDVALKFTGEGTSKSPIILKAQTKGGGQSASVGHVGGRTDLGSRPPSGRPDF